jgi:hypothetical protein
MIEATVKLESVTITGTVHPLKGERYSCDIGHFEIFPDGQGYDVLDEALGKFRGQRVKINITPE